MVAGEMSLSKPFLKETKNNSLLPKICSPVQVVAQRWGDGGRWDVFVETFLEGDKEQLFIAQDL